MQVLCGPECQSSTTAYNYERLMWHSRVISPIDITCCYGCLELKGYFLVHLSCSHVEGHVASCSVRETCSALDTALYMTRLLLAASKNHRIQRLCIGIHRFVFPDTRYRLDAVFLKAYKGPFTVSLGCWLASLVRKKTRSRCASVRVSSSISYARRAWHSFNFPCQVRQRGEKGGMNRQQRQEDGSRTAWDTLLLYTMGPVGSYVKSQEICARGESNASFPGTRSRCAAAHGLHSFMSYMYIFAYTYIYIYSRVLYAPHIICIQLCRQIFLQQDGSGPFLGKPLLAFILECLNPASTLRSISAVLLNHVRKCWPC